jgi:hypothetical protein
MFFSVVRTNLSLAGYPAESGSGGALWGQRLNNLTRRDTAKLAGTLSTQFFAGKTLFLLSTRQRQNDLRDQIHREFVYRPLQFHERRQQFLRTHNETPSVVAMGISNPDCSFVLIHG